MNGEYFVFMQDKGYECFELWQMEGIEWVCQFDIKVLLYWYEKDGKWYYYILIGL